MDPMVAYIAAALLGALVGGGISFAVSSRNARRERRARYGEALVSELAHAERSVVGFMASTEAQAERANILRDHAILVWSRAELASSIESPAGRKAMRRWGLVMYDALTQAGSGQAQLDALERRLDLAIILVIAWTAGYASGADFSRPDAEIERLYGPDLDVSETS